MDPKVLLSVFVIIASCNANLTTVNGKIKIQVVTTAGCRDTVNFIAVLNSVFAEFGQFLELDFVPWGRTTVNNNGALSCQFGTSDCWANRLHRCVVSRLENKHDLLNKYMACEFVSPFPAYNWRSYECVFPSGVNLVEIDNCVVGQPGDELDVAFQEAAREPMRVINFVPAIVFNDVIDINLHRQARSNLRGLICNALAADPSTGVTQC